MSNWYNVPFYYVPSDSKPESERELLAKTRNTDLLIMARYMQILSPQFLSEYRRPVVNIHHSFLPSFTGARPYHQAIERGVKLIGATAHFATNELDEGPIITQKVAPVTHRHCLKDLIEIGKYLEKKCLLDAVQQISEHRVMVYQNKTIVFE
jgi:formyltetrahydrofolate deformylase